MPLRVGAIYLLTIAAIAALVPVWAKFAKAANEFRPPDKIAFDLQAIAAPAAWHRKTRSRPSPPRCRSV